MRYKCVMPYVFDMNIQRLRYLILTAVAALALQTKVLAQDGTSAYSFLNVTSSSRIYALGGINISTVEDDVNIIGQNPALLGQEMSKQIGVNYMHYLSGGNFAGIRYANAVGSHGAIAGNIEYFGYGSMKHTDEFGNVLGDFSPKDLSFGIAYSHDITDRLRGAINLKMVYNSYEQYSAFAVATDLGINYYNPDSDMSLSAVVANLGGQVKRFNERYDRLPIDVRLGWTKSFGSFPVRFSITAWNLTKWHLPYLEVGDGSSDSEPVMKDKFMSNLFRHLVFGADFAPNDKFYIALGYNYKTRTDMATYSRNFLSGVSLGAGLSLPKFRVGLAYAQPHSGASTFMLNLTLNLTEFLD